jgi:hypothetical protein
VELSGQNTLGKYILIANLFCALLFIISPFRPKLEAFADKAARAPLMSLFSALIKDWMPLIDEYYYCL